MRLTLPDAHAKFGLPFYIIYDGIEFAIIKVEDAIYWHNQPKGSGGLYFCETKNDKTVFEIGRRTFFNVQLNELLENSSETINKGESNMVRLTYKEVNGNVINRKPVVFNENVYNVIIKSDFTWDVLVNDVVSYTGTSTSLIKAKKDVKAYFINLGITFGTDVRSRKGVNEVMAA